MQMLISSICIYKDYETDALNGMRHYKKSGKQFSFEL